MICRDYLTLLLFWNNPKLCMFIITYIDILEYINFYVFGIMQFA